MKGANRMKNIIKTLPLIAIAVAGVAVLKKHNKIKTHLIDANELVNHLSKENLLHHLRQGRSKR